MQLYVFEIMCVIMLKNCNLLYCIPLLYRMRSHPLTNFFRKIWTKFGQI